MELWIGGIFVLEPLACLHSVIEGYVGYNYLQLVQDYCTMHSLLCTYYVTIPDSTRYATVSDLFRVYVSYMYVMYMCIN